MIFSVFQLNEYIKSLLDGDDCLQSVFVRGEISNFKAHSSGHLYMSLKDESGVIRAVMFRASASRLKFRMENGMKIIAHGRVSVFPRDGSYQLYMDDATPDGVGALYVAFEQLKKTLGEQGLFDPAHKKPIPRFPTRIGIVTSPTGAAIRDMLRILSARYPLAKVILYPVRVQGEEAPTEIAEGIAFLNHFRLADVIITGRGGGSIEDLWAFNDERVAYAIYRSEIPVISAVGHEPDVTISDFVADLRAATPSNAAELAVPDSGELQSMLLAAKAQMLQSIGHTIRSRRDALRHLSSQRVMQSPQFYLEDKRMAFEYTRDRFVSAMQADITSKKQEFLQLTAKLDALSPMKVMTRGFSVVTDPEKGIITDASRLSSGDRLTIRFASGKADCTVNETFEERTAIEREQV